MTNYSSGTNDERNHHHTYSGDNPPPPPQSSGLRHNAGISVYWTDEELAILDNGLAKYSSVTLNVTCYAKIACELPHKTVRDVAMRCRWKYNMDNNKRKKEDDDGVNNKELIDMLMASNPTEEDMISIKLLEENNELLNQISENLTSLKLIDNYTLLATSRENIRKLLTNLNENVPERMKYMPPLPERLNDELLAEPIFPLSDLP